MTTSLTIGLAGFYREIRMKSPRRQAKLWERPLIQLTLRVAENYSKVAKVFLIQIYKIEMPRG
jgi:hypothetical protein